MYTLVAVFLGSKVIDYVIEGLNNRTAVTIISDHSDAIRQFIVANMSRGVTILEGRGGYSQNQKEVLYIVINQQELMQLKQTVSSVDEQAFVVVHEVRDVLGSGFSVS